MHHTVAGEQTMVVPWSSGCVARVLRVLCAARLALLQAAIDCQHCVATYKRSRQVQNGYEKCTRVMQAALLCFVAVCTGRVLVHLVCCVLDGLTAGLWLTGQLGNARRRVNSLNVQLISAIPAQGCSQREGGAVRTAQGCENARIV